MYKIQPVDKQGHPVAPNKDLSEMTDEELNQVDMLTICKDSRPVGTFFGPDDHEHAKIATEALNQQCNND